ncbi:hypothetical protein SS1G_12736 [Sclerotinia sclerotiorum 1980 UF-70]|uniref:Uncharacterized protein n=1 Tax=Sclerotinia sclerotiorum (strain ATCC 18683 / 1980 / Ss-1) TaxID=665079 RepID=A7F561_SCLS1|nr:hypothetical protein SS1G_12736 [Sclerotinia sclerotiorum 1980 UF-70]EDN97882.1 hypothetical protein SS1G_12736 [Sclerotinia sclerotiorum 1980 UF-70]
MHFNTCVECCTVICTYCHKQHENKTCAEHEDETSGNCEETLQSMKKLGIKSCPKLWSTSLLGVPANVYGFRFML